jgi:hypothetical protein
MSKATAALSAELKELYVDAMAFSAFLPVAARPTVQRFLWKWQELHKHIINELENIDAPKT